VPVGSPTTAHRRSRVTRNTIGSEHHPTQQRRPLSAKKGPINAEEQRLQPRPPRRTATTRRPPQTHAPHRRGPPLNRFRAGGKGPPKSYRGATPARTPHPSQSPCAPPTSHSTPVPQAEKHGESSRPYPSVYPGPYDAGGTLPASFGRSGMRASKGPNDVLAESPQDENEIVRDRLLNVMINWLDSQWILPPDDVNQY